MTEEKKECKHKYTLYDYKMKAGETKPFCACGKSEAMPLCDISHAAFPGKEPRIITAKEDMTVRICGCGNSSDSLLCDDTCCEDEKNER